MVPSQGRFHWLTSTYSSGDRISQRRQFTANLLNSPGMEDIRSVLNESNTNAEKLLSRPRKNPSFSKRNVTLEQALTEVDVGAVIILSKDACGKKVKSDQRTLQLAVDAGP